MALYFASLNLFLHETVWTIGVLPPGSKAPHSVRQESPSGFYLPRSIEVARAECETGGRGEVPVYDHQIRAGARVHWHLFLRRGRSEAGDCGCGCGP